MKLADTIKLRNLHGAAAGSQATVPDSRSADQWIKNYLDKKNQRLNDMRMKLHRLLDFNQKGYVKTGPSDKENEAAERGIWGAWNVYKDTVNQDVDLIGDKPWAVVDPEGLVISTWDTRDEAVQAAWPMYHGIAPSSTGATAGTRVMRTSEVKKLKGLHAGGEGSGCRGPNCGRPSEVVAYHGTSDEAARKIFKEGLVPGPNLKSVYASDDKEVALGYARERASKTLDEEAYNRAEVGLVVVDPEKAGMDQSYSSHYTVVGKVPPEAILRVEFYRLADITTETGHLKSGLRDAEPVKVLKAARSVGEVYIPFLLRRAMQAGGVGSGCQGPNCGRPRYRQLFHGTSLSNALDIVKNGFKANEEGYVHFFGDDPGVADSYGMMHDEAYAILYFNRPKDMELEKDPDPEALLGKNSVRYKGDFKPEDVSVEVYSKDGEPVDSWHSSHESFSALQDLASRAREIEAADIFEDTAHGDRTRAKFLKRPKPPAVRWADFLRNGDRRPSSGWGPGSGAAGTGGAGGPSGGGGGTS